MQTTFTNQAIGKAWSQKFSWLWKAI